MCRHVRHGRCHSSARDHPEHRADFDAEVTEAQARQRTNWADAAETGVILLAGGVVVWAIRNAVSLVVVVTPVSDLLDPEVAPNLTLTAFPWADCLAVLLGFALLPIAYEFRLHRVSLAEIGFRIGHNWHLALTASVATGTGLWFWSKLIYPVLHLEHPRLMSGSNAGLVVLTWLIVAGSEEIFFRGMLQRRLTRTVGPVLAILAISAIFAFAGHVRSALIINVALRLPAGILLGLLYHYSKSLAPPYLAHWMLNVLIMLG